MPSRLGEIDHHVEIKCIKWKEENKMYQMKRRVCLIFPLECLSTLVLDTYIVILFCIWISSTSFLFFYNHGCPNQFVCTSINSMGS